MAAAIVTGLFAFTFGCLVGLWLGWASERLRLRDYRRRLRVRRRVQEARQVRTAESPVLVPREPDPFAWGME